MLMPVLRRRATFALALLTLAAATTLSAQRVFPASWVGRWEGTLTTLAPPDSVRNQIPIELTIARDTAPNAYIWRTIFNADTVRGLRPYRLLVERSERGQYATDESNGVLLEDTFLGGTLRSVFQVGTRVLQSVYAVRGDTLTHELTWWESTPSRTTAGAGANAEGGVAVAAFRVMGMQRAVMVRRAAGVGHGSKKAQRASKRTGPFRTPEEGLEPPTR
jgi:hypothetical protein